MMVQDSPRQVVTSKYQPPALDQYRVLGHLVNQLETRGYTGVKGCADLTALLHGMVSEV